MTDEVVDVDVDEEEVRNLPAIRASEAIVARGELSVQEVVAQKDKIKQVMDAVMTRDIHYGVIPGVSKPSLFKPGAEAINVALRLAPHYDSEKIWHDDGHLTVVAKCTLKHIPTDLTIATGEGLCTTKEERYAYRKAERVCPNCGKEAIIKGKAEYGGGWLCWNKKGGCGAKFPDGDHSIESQDVGKVPNENIADLYNCVTPETLVLTRDLRWVRAGELVTGDVLIGVNEDLPNPNGRRYEDATVTIGERFEDDLYEILMEDGRVVRCNGEHRWLVKNIGSGVSWVSTKEMFDEMAVKENGKRARTGNPRRWMIMTVGAPWVADSSFDGGYMAGLLDGEGCLSISQQGNYTPVGMSFAQQEGGMLRRYLHGLATHGFVHKMYAHGNKRMRKPVQSIVLGGGFLEVMRALGTYRPPRLLERWFELELGRRRFEGKPIRVHSISEVGRGELVRIGTSSRTYIAQGMVCHNTVLKMADKRALIAAVLNGTAASDVFTQDVEDQPQAAAQEGREAPPSRQEGPLPLPPPTSWAKITEYVSAYDEDTYNLFNKFGDAARRRLFPGSVDASSLSRDEKDELFRVTAKAALALRNEVEVGEFPPPTIGDVRKAWAQALDGEELAIEGEE